MSAWVFVAIDHLWHNALAVIPLVLLVTVTCRILPCRPTTRHLLWLTALAGFVGPTFLPRPTLPETAAGLGSILVHFNSEPAISGHEETIPLEPKTAELNSLVSSFEFLASLGLVTTISATEVANRDDLFGSYPSKQTPADDRLPFIGRDLIEFPPLRTVARAGSLEPERLAPAHDTGGRPFELVDRNAKGGTALAEAQESASLLEDEWPPRSAEAAVLDDAPSVLADQSPPIDRKENADAFSEPPGWKRWIAVVGGVRDGLMNLPPVPPLIWLLGSAVLIFSQVIRVARFRRRIAKARPASLPVRDLVAGVAKRIGLSRLPETLVVNDRVSPMVWCGSRPKLVLPARLWDQLDEVGQRAVVCHELAHLKRKDHWIRRLQFVVDAVYWWHPLLWWVRHRLNAEAEVCCDAWVTWLLPRGRRAYAEALLRTNQYLTEGNVPLPTVGIGMTTGRAGRFARRLTMVMTETIKPKLSIPGALLAVLLAATGWIAAPARSCPPKEGTEQHALARSEEDAKPCAERKPCAQVAPGAVTAVSPSVVTAPTVTSTSTFESHLAKKTRDNVNGIAQTASNDSQNRDLEKRMERLERELARLTDRLGRLNDGPRGEGQTGRPLNMEYTPFPAQPPHPPHAAHAPHAAFAPIPPLPLQAPQPPIPGRTPRAPRMMGRPGLFTPLPGDDGNVIARTYKVPEGKREALSALMVRSDVPIRVRPTDDGIEVNATQSQHEVFAAFLGLIDPSEEHGGHGGFQFRFAPGVDPRFLAEEAMARAQVIEKQARRGSEDAKKNAERARKEMERALKQQQKQIEKWHERMDGYEKGSQRMKALEEMLSHQSEAVEQLNGQFQERAHQIWEQARTVWSQSAPLWQEADRLHLQASECAGEESERFATAARELEDRARDVEDEARGVEDYARGIENQLQEAGQSILELRDTLRALEDEAEGEDDEEDSAEDEQDEDSDQDDEDEDDAAVIRAPRDL